MVAFIFFPIFTIIIIFFFTAIIGSIKNADEYNTKQRDIYKKENNNIVEGYRKEDNIEFKDFDASQSNIHKHDGFEENGPIKYN